MRKITVIILISLTITGCALDLRYAKTGASDEDTQRALADCKVKAAMVPGNDAWAALAAGNARDNCMRAQGWVRTQ